MAGNFAHAAKAHFDAGMPQASDEQVAERFAICAACPLYKKKDDESGSCNHSKCGCNVKAVGLSGLNKLRWAEQACPAGHWGAVDAYNTK
jgi:hypothetical protein